MDKKSLFVFRNVVGIVGAFGVFSLIFFGEYIHDTHLNLDKLIISIVLFVLFAIGGLIIKRIWF